MATGRIIAARVSVARTSTSVKAARRRRDRPHYLVFMRRVARDNRAAGFDRASADDQRVLAAELSGDVGQRLLHCVADFAATEVGMRFVVELGLRLFLRGRGFGADVGWIHHQVLNRNMFPIALPQERVVRRVFK